MRVLAVSACCLCLGACASSDGLEQELSRIRRDLHGVQKDLAETRHQMERLEGRVTLLSLGHNAVRPAPKTRVSTAEDPASAPPRAAVTRRAGNKVLPVVRLGAKAEAAPEPEKTWVDPGAVDDGQPPVLIKLGPSGDVPDRLPVDRSVLKKPDPVLDADDGRGRRLPPREQYKAALDVLRDEKDPQRALLLFARFLEDHPSSRLADNAVYWSGECLFILARYEESIAKMESMMERFPRSAKVPHALLRVGESWLAIGARDKGLETLRRVIDRHPTSEAARRARARLDIEGGQP